MEYTTLGGTGMSVSRICLGCMSFGSPEWRNWVLDESDSRDVIERAIDLGINFFDTANIYSKGESERILGEILGEYDRDRHVVATKVYNQMDPDNPNSGGLSRKVIEQELEKSLDRLNLETIDLYQIHRWDYDTPVETTLSALTDVLARGRVRHIGASAMWAHQFAEALHTSERLGYDRFVTMQNHYNLVYREEEREMLPLCRRKGVGVIPFSPLARGYLARPDEEFVKTRRAEYIEGNDRFSKRIDNYRANGGIKINERVQELADEKDVTMAQIALAWLLRQEPVDSVIVGTTSVKHLEDAVDAVALTLSDSDIAYLEEPYGPVQVDAHR